MQILKHAPTNQLTNKSISDINFMTILKPFVRFFIILQLSGESPTKCVLHLEEVTFTSTICEFDEHEQYIGMD